MTVFFDEFGMSGFSSYYVKNSLNYLAFCGILGIMVYILNKH